MNEIIRIENLTHTYGEGTPFRRSAVEDMSLDIYRGEFLGLIGHTGSGKSTLIQHFNGLLKPTAGRVLLDGQDIWAEPKKIRAVRFRVGLVFQYPEYQLFEETVYRDIAFGPTNMGLSGEELDRRVHDAARFAGLDEGLLQKSPFALSGGQKRRVAIAGVIAMEPKCIVLDEPTAMLDPAGRREVVETVTRLCREKGITVVLITHHMNECIGADRVIVMSNGVIVADGAPKDVFRQSALLRREGLTVPVTTELLEQLSAAGMALPLDALTVDACADAIAGALAGAPQP